MMKPFRMTIMGTMIFLLMSSGIAYGAGWITKRLTYTSGASYHPAIVVNGLNIYIVWQDHTPGVSQIYFIRSADGGKHWKSVKKLTTKASIACTDPVIAVNGSSLYVTWTAEDILYEQWWLGFMKSADGGATWSAAKNPSDIWGSSWSPQIAVNGSNIYIVWDEGNANDIYFVKSANGGATWQPAKRLSFSDEDDHVSRSHSPAIAVNGSNIYVVGSNNKPGNDEIYFMKSANGGATWQAVKRLTNNAGWSKNPTIAVNASNIYVFWDDNTPGNNEIYFRKSADGGNRWKAAKRLTNDAGMSENPRIAVNASNIYISWKDYSDKKTYATYFMESADGGATWQPAESLLHYSDYYTSPEIAVNSSKIYVVYVDKSPGNSEIYLKYKTE
jgi:hypothetical protein